MNNKTYLKKNLNIQDLYTKIYKLLMREMKIDSNKWGDKNHDH